jgi:hypothetical protein
MTGRDGNEGNMAKQEFLSNFRIARNLFAHPHVPTDSSQINPQAMERMLARAAIWLTPKSVKGFNADDFPELGIDRQRELQAAVREFLEVAKEVPPNEPATPEQFGNAQVAFAKMLTILQPYLPTSQEGEQVEEALKRVDFPPWIVNWDYELGSDEDGSPAVWINLFADQDSAPRREFGPFASQVTTTIRQALSVVGSNRWPYVRLRTAVEHKQT